MKIYKKQELEEALRAIDSTLSKCEKAVVKLKDHSAQQTLMLRRIAAFRISAELIQKELLIVAD